MELKRDEIIKALECCHTPLASDCNDCGYRGQSVENGEYIGCSNRLLADALALIKELTEENERLRAENEALAISEVKECEISQMLVYRIRHKHPAVMAVISDTVRKMQERLKKALEHYPQRCGDCFKERVDQIAKEILEENKNED